MKKKQIAYITLIILLAFAVMVPIAGAYDTYTGCAGCHGSFRASTYSSLATAKAANPAWPGTSLALHNGHANGPTGSPPGMLNGNCNACHFGASRIPVYTYQSSGAAPFNQSCMGCHDGPGLRAHHVNSGADTCYDCHSDPAPDPENVLRPVYAAAFGTTSGTTGVNDPCDPSAAGFEGRLKDVANLGLDNDGNLLYDQADPACVVAAAKISLSPTTLSFGNQATGSSSAAQTVTISNTGSASLSVTGITNNNTTDFSVTAPPTPFSVAAGGSQTFSVVFSPVSTGAKSATITVASNAGNPTVSLTGTGTVPPQPVLGVSPPTLAFGNQTIGTTSAAKAVTISNTGTGTLNVTGITSTNAEFAFSPTSIAPIAAGGSATLNITFTPAVSGARSANISIFSNGGNATVSATGTGVAAGAVSVSPATLTYGNQTVGTTSATQTVTISNTGGTALTVNSITNSNTTDFVLTAPATPLTINGGASQTFTVAFKPAASGAKTASVSVVTTAGNATVSATGTGVAAGAVSVSPATLTYGNQTVGTTSATQTVTISNTGGTALTVNSITNSNTTDFVLAAPATPLTINGGASQTFTVAFKPAASGAKTATISVATTAGNATVSATGTGVAAGAVSVSPATLTYGNQTVGTTSATQTVTISNTGGTALTVNSITNSNTTDFVLAAPATPLTINGGASQTFTVAFKPAASGAKTASVSVATTAGNATVSATGTGVAAGAVSVSPATLTYGNQTVGTTSATQTVTISNTGGTALTVNSITNSNTTDFVLAAPATPLTINGGASQTFTVAFKPAASGAKTASVSVVTTAGNATVSATGTGVAAGAVSVSPATLTYGNQTVGTTSATQTVTISNTGGTALTVNSITNSNTTDFVLAAPATPLTINGGASQTFTVAFKPAASGAKTASVSVVTTAGNATVSATGTGVLQPPTRSGDVALVKLSVPSTVTVKVGQALDIHVLAQATTTNKEVDAAVNLKAVSDINVKVNIDHASLRKKIYSEANSPQNFDFEAKISCTKKGTWPVTWTAKIKATRNSNPYSINSNPYNDTLKGTTQVTCSDGDSDEESLSSH